MEENNLIKLQGKVFEGMEVEIIQDENGEPLFELYSTGMALGQTKTAKDKIYPRKERIEKTLKNGSIPTVVRHGQQYLTEDALYDFMLEAHTNKCKSFRKWVTKEVIPSIRKHGAYITNEKLEEFLTSPDTMIKVLQNLKEEQEKNKRLQSEALEMLPKVEQYDNLMNSHDLLSMNETAKSIGVGRNDLFNLLREKSILMTDKKNKKDHNVPYQRYIDSKYFTVVEHEIMGETQPQTLVSTKGLDWLNKKLSKDWKDELKNIKKEIIENNKNNKAS